ncbi:hypothetical protein F5J12DRAFT_787215 [Pisolithus orientalis]|uniref:uncharacterized protein n=1 Tax=Pisolithus orientalis TaxID=936130 RepID=UPI002224CC17|nr:uncharacterized protein F5J12DRAFT_787215 [Pisolithus orientalis]KAI5986704.1 hypothetical protein F5J12DRAFT_787215 [Pisolithus orientalis]
MHLESVHEMFTYLESCYGSIPRPASWRAVEDAVQSDDWHKPSLALEKTSATPQNILLDLLATLNGERDNMQLLSKPVAVTPTLNGPLELEMEVVPCKAGSGQMDEPEDTNPEVSNSHIDKTSTIGTCGQLVNMTRDLHLFKPSSETFDLAINSTNLKDSCIIETTLQMPVEHDQCIQTCSGLIADIPDPLSAHVACSNLSTQCPGQVFGTMNTECKLAQAQTFDNGEVTLPHPHEVQMTPLNLNVPANEPKWLQDPQEAKWPQPEQDHMQAM